MRRASVALPCHMLSFTFVDVVAVNLNSNEGPEAEMEKR